MTVVLMLLIGAGVLTTDTGEGRAALSGFACQGGTDNAALNRTLCRYHPARLWNMPISEIIPGLRTN